jgi:hypothetical protein
MLLTLGGNFRWYCQTYNNIFVACYPYVDIIVLQDSNHYSPSSVVGVREALANLKKAIMSCPGEGATQVDRETTDFLYNWLKNNKANYQPAAQVSSPFLPRKGLLPL